MRTSQSLRSFAALTLLAAAARPVSSTTFTGFGDSITYGTQSSWGEGYLTIYRYYNGWEMPSVSVENQGVPDETTSQGLARIGSAISQTGATHILIMEGTNDITQGVSAGTIVGNLQAMAGIADGSGVVPVIGCPPPRRSSDTRDPGNGNAAAVSQDMEAFAQSSGYPFAAIFDTFMAEPCPDCLLADRVHPDDSGYYVMARAWHVGLRPTFGPPELTAATPDWATAGVGGTITLTGSALAAGMQGYLFNMLNYNQQVWSLTGVSVGSQTQATATVDGTVPLGLYDVVLAYPTGGGAVLHQGFSASLPPPTALTLTPNAVPAAQSTTITLATDNLQSTSEVYFGGVKGTGFTWVSPWQGSVVNPPLAPGIYDVRIVGGDRAEATFPAAFYSLGTPPTILSISPGTADNWSAVNVTIGGSAFQAGAAVTFGATAMPSAAVISASQIDVVVPAGFPLGTYDVTVRNPDTQSFTYPAGYTSEPPTPVVTTVAPATVEAGNRTAITVDGDRFELGATLAAGAVPLVNVVRVSGQQLTAMTPQSLTPGVYDVVVTNPSGRFGTLVNGLTVEDTTAPALVLAHPADGRAGASRDTRIQLWLQDAGGGIDTASIQLDVNATPVAGFTVDQGPRLARISYDPPASFTPSQPVTVRVRTLDLASPGNSLDQTISFTVTDGVDGTDGDGLPTDFEVAEGLDPASSAGPSGSAGDPDRDLLGNAAELAAGWDPTSRAMVVAAPGPGASNPARAVRLLPGLQGLDGALVLPYSGYGLQLGCGDLEADGSQDVVTGPGPSPVYGPQVRAFRGANLTSLPKVNFYAYGTLKYGVKVGGGALEGGQRQVIVTGPGPGAVFGPQVRAFRYDGNLAALPKVSFFAYATLKYGVNPGAADMDGDGFAEILTGAPSAPVFGPHVRGFNYDNTTVTAIGKVSFYAYGTLKYGVAVASGDLDADGYDEIVTGPGAGAVFLAQVRGFDVDGGTAAAIPGLSFLAFPTGTYFGAKVAAGDLDGDRRADIVAGQGEGPTLEARIRAFRWSGTIAQTADVHAFDGTSYGVNVACGLLGLLP